MVRTGDTSRRKAWEDRFDLKPGGLSELVYMIEPADRATVGGVKSEVIWNDIARRFNLTREEEKMLQDDFYAGDILNHDFYSFMKRLRVKYRTALLSNAWENARTIYTEQYRLGPLFDVMVISAEVGMQKPERRIYTYTLELIRAKGEEVIFIDDIEENCVAAEKVGIHAIPFTDAPSVIASMKKFLVNN
ncbi:MAG: hypothetical protein RLZZ455_18 [Candidatus Parcubacteria bacterium]